MSQAKIDCPLCTSLGMRCGICGPGKEEPTSRPTLSTDELAALAEARGLRLVSAEHVLDLDAARAAGAAAEREECAHRLEESARLLDGLAAECVAGSESRRIYETQAETIRAAIHAIRARSNGGAR